MTFDKLILVVLCVIVWEYLYAARTSSTVSESIVNQNVAHKLTRIDAVLISYIQNQITHILSMFVVSLFFIILFYRPIYNKIK